MTILSLFRTKRGPIVTSRPIFQHASSFLRDDDEEDLKKHMPLPLFHKQPDSKDSEPKPRPRPQARLHLILHVLNLIFTFTSACLFIAVIPIWDANYQHTRSIISTDYTDGLVLAPLLLSISFSTYLLVKEHTSFGVHLRPRFFNRNGVKSFWSPTALRPITLSLLCLTILLTLAPALTLSATNSLALIWRAPARTKQGTIVCNLANVFAQQCQPVLYQIGGLQIGGIAAGASAWLVWLVVLSITIQIWARERMKRMREAKEKRWKRHEKRRGRRHGHGYGHEHGHRHRHGHRHGDRPGHRRHHEHSEEHKVWNGHKNSKGHLEEGNGRTQKSTVSSASSYKAPCDKNRYDSRSDRVNDKTDHLRPTEAQGGSLAAHVACRKVQPKETIQVWLHNRYAEH